MEEITRPDPEDKFLQIEVDGWTTPPRLKDLQQDETDAKTDHDKQKGKIRDWLDNLNIEGSAKIPVVKGRSSVQPRLIRKQAEWRYAALSEPFLASDDLFDIDPVTWEDVEASRQNALLLNHQMNTKVDKVDFVDTMVRAAVDEGTAIVQVGWHFEEKEVTKRQPMVRMDDDPDMAPLYQEITELEDTNPSGYQYEVPQELQMAHEYFKETGRPANPVITGYEDVTEMKTIHNAPTLEVCDYRNVIIDPSCEGKYREANFFIKTFKTTLSALRKEGGKYQNLDEVDVSAASPLADSDYETDNSRDAEPVGQARKPVVVREYWGYWDYDDSGIAKPFVAAWVGDVMIRLEESPFPDDKLPFVVIPLLPVRHSAYGEPDGELLIENQKIIGAVTRGMIDLMGRSANGQMAVRKDALDATNKRRFQQGKDYEYNAGVDPRMAFYMHQFPEIPQSAQYMIDYQNNDAESMVGVKAFANGISSDGLGQVATGIRGALDAASKREAGILRRLAKGVGDVGRKMIAMNGELLDDKEIIRITNESFVAIRRDELAGDFDLRVDVSSLEEDNIKAQELAFMLQTMGNNMDPGMSKIILRDIARLRKMPELAKKIENYEPQPDPMAEKMQQLEMQKIEAEIEEIRSKTMGNYEKGELDDAKTKTEEAKARQLSSDADKKDLDFVEQESGVTQEREKELHGEQARANQDLEHVKAGLKARGEAGDKLKDYVNQGAA